VILLLNGAFGIGKTTLAEALIVARPEWVLFDPEDVGQVLRRALHRVHPKEDFQEYAGWVPLVAATAKELRKEGRDLILPICIADRVRYAALVSHLREVDDDLRTFCLIAGVEVVHRRLTERGDDPAGWAAARTRGCVEAHRDPLFAEHLNAEGSVPALVSQVLAATIAP
jgi:chloramphenicol 3-O-phosphotransferase